MTNVAPEGATEATKRPFAVFDIDGTLIRWQLFHAIVHTLGKHDLLPEGAHERIKAAHMKWKCARTVTGLSYMSALFGELFSIANKRQWKIVVERKSMVYSLMPQPQGGGYVLE